MVVALLGHEIKAGREINKNSKRNIERDSNYVLLQLFLCSHSRSFGPFRRTLLADSRDLSARNNVRTIVGCSRRVSLAMSRLYDVSL